MSGALRTVLGPLGAPGVLWVVVVDALRGRGTGGRPGPGEEPGR